MTAAVFSAPRAGGKPDRRPLVFGVSAKSINLHSERICARAAQDETFARPFGRMCPHFGTAAARVTVAFARPLNMLQAPKTSASARDPRDSHPCAGRSRRRPSSKNTATRFPISAIHAGWLDVRARRPILGVAAARCDAGALTGMAERCFQPE